MAIQPQIDFNTYYRNVEQYVAFLLSLVMVISLFGPFRCSAMKNPRNSVKWFSPLQPEMKIFIQAKERCWNVALEIGRTGQATPENGIFTVLVISMSSL